MPIFCPRTSAADVGKSIHPLKAIVIVIVIAALEDCTIIVRKTPTVIKINTDKIPKSV